MGSAYYIVLEKRPKGLDTFVNGKALARAAKELARVAAKLKVPAMEEFFSLNPGEMAEMMGEEPEEPPAELVMKLKEKPAAGFVYYVAETEVKRVAKKRPGVPAAAAETVAVLPAPADKEAWLYFVDDRGNVMRSAKGWRPAPQPGEPAERWFEPGEALKTFRALHAHAVEKRKADVADDLARFVEVLEACARRKLRFHLAIDI